MSKSQAIVRVTNVAGQSMPVTFRRFQHHVTASTPGKDRLIIKLADDGRFVCRINGKSKKIADASRANKAFDRAVRQVWF